MSARRHAAGRTALFASLMVSSVAIAQPQTPAPGPAPKTTAPAAPAPPATATQQTWDLVNNPARENGVFQFDFGIPSSPSLNLLGQPEDKVTVVNGLKPFILQLPRILGRDAQNGQSLGLDFSPAWLLGDASQRTYERYTEGTRLYRALYRTHAGVALYEGVADADPAKARASRIAVGLSTSLLDSSDPLMARLPGRTMSAWQECMNNGANALQAALNASGAADGGARDRLETEKDQLAVRRDQLEARRTQLRQSGVSADNREFQDVEAELGRIGTRTDEIDAQRAPLETAQRAALQASFARSEAARIIPRCAQEANLVARYGASLGLGVGALWNGDPGRVRNLSSGGWVAWASFRHPLGVRFNRGTDGALKASNYWMIGFAGRAAFDENVATNIAATPQVRANVFDGWGGIEYLSSASRFSLQIGYQIRDTEGRLASFDRERLRYFASYSQRLGGENSGIWLRAGYGHARSSDDDDEALTISIIFAPPSPANIFGTN